MPTTGTTAGGDPDNVEEAWVDAGDSDAPPGFDRVSGNSTFAYDDENGISTRSGCSTRRAPSIELTLLDRAGIREVALWRLGAEDPGLWSIFGRNVSVRAAPPASPTSRKAPMSTSRAGRNPSDHRASDAGRTAADLRPERPHRQRRFPARSAAVHDHSDRLSARPDRSDFRRWPGRRAGPRRSSTS